MFFSHANWRDSLVKNILGGEEKVRVANLFFSKQNVRLGRLPIGGEVGKFWKILVGLWQHHTFWLVPTLFGRFYMPNKIGYVSYLRKSPFGPLSGPKWPTSGFFGDFFGFSFIKWELLELQTWMLDHFWSKFYFWARGTIILGLKVIWRSFKVISRSFEGHLREIFSFFTLL